MDISSQAYSAAVELLTAANIEKGGIIVIGCSTSEIGGGDIGKNSSPEIAEAVLDGILRAAGEFGVGIAAQCCEHLNRALVVERADVDLLLKVGAVQRVHAVPQPKAGGSLASAYYRRCGNPVLVEKIAADGGLDIGGTLIGMHLKRVAVPVKLKNCRIGAAHVTAARVRVPFTGGERAVYDAKLM